MPTHNLGGPADNVRPRLQPDPDPSTSPDAMRPPDGKTMGFGEIFRGFALSGAQVSKEPETKAGKTLARMAAKEIAKAEDTQPPNAPGSSSMGNSGPRLTACPCDRSE